MNKYTQLVKQKVSEILISENILENTDKIVVGFSGGADSVCLLHILKNLGDEFNFKVKAIHINHGIRGEEAKRDQDFTYEFCEKHDIPYSSQSFDCIGIAKTNKMSLEECGRKIRYEIFESFCGGKTKVATAHNANDNAETVLFNLMRGSGIKGACGIPVVRGDIIRPLLFCTRDEIEGYCEENKLDFVVDSTNLSDEYTRNKIRHNILPEMAKINSNAIGNINNFSLVAKDVEDYIDIQAQNALEQAFVSENTYSLDVLSGLHIAVLSRCISNAFFDMSGIVLNRDKITVISSIISNGGRAQLYGEIYVEAVKGNLRFFVYENSKTDDFINIESFNNEILFNRYKIGFSKLSQNSEKFNKKLLDNLIDCDKIVGKLSIRCRSEGDSVRIRNRVGTKSLKKLFNENNISVEKRNILPIICDDEGIVWVHSIGVCERCSVNENSCNIVYVKGEDNDE